MEKFGTFINNNIMTSANILHGEFDGTLYTQNFLLKDHKYTLGCYHNDKGCIQYGRHQLKQEYTKWRRNWQVFKLGFFKFVLKLNK